MQNPINPGLSRPNQPSTLRTNSTRAADFPPVVGPTEQDGRIVTLEQRVAHLENLVQQLTSVLVVGSQGSEVLLKARTIKLEAAIDMDVKVGTNALISAGSNLTLRSASAAKLEGAALTEVRSGGATKLNGSTITLNNGSKPVARQTDNVAAVSGGSMIVGGNSTVLA